MKQKKTRGGGKNRVRVAVLTGGQSTEHNVSLASGRNVLEHFDRKQYRPFLVIIDRRGGWHFGYGKAEPASQALEKIHSRADVVFLALHGAFGEDGTVQALLEAFHIPYTGSGVSASALAMDKDLSNRIARSSEFHVPEWKAIDTENVHWNIKLPVVLKPIRGGSSVGTEIIRKNTQKQAAYRRAKRFGALMLQRFIRGREMTCGVLERHGKPFALPPTEIQPTSSKWFDYKAKYSIGGSKEVTPAQLTPRQTRQLQSLATQAHRMLGCRGMSRTDFIFANGTFWFLETNTIPGLTKTSLLPQQAQAAGISFTKLLDLITAAAFRTKK